jgi:hypothetical protein
MYTALVTPGECSLTSIEPRKRRWFTDSNDLFGVEVAHIPANTTPMYAAPILHKFRKRDVKTKRRKHTSCLRGRKVFLPYSQMKGEMLN